MSLDRAGGTSPDVSQCSGNPPAIFLAHISYKPIIDALAARGFSDARTGEAAFMLQRVSLQHMQPYLDMVARHPKGSAPCIKEACDLMSFDRRFQSAVFKYIGVFETQFRAQYAHMMERESGEMSLYDASLFLRPDNYERSREHYDTEARRKAGRRGTAAHHAACGGDKLPVGIGVECMTLGTLSQFYANTRSRVVTDTVAQSFGCSKAELTSWARTICDVRNICAHFDAYMSRRQIPSVPLRISRLGADNKSPFYVIHILLKLLAYPGATSDWNPLYASRMQDEISGLIEVFSGPYGHLLGPLGISERWREDMACSVTPGP